MERQQDYVLRSVEERGIRFIRLWFTDVLGQLKSIAIVPGELENAFEEGMTFDGSAIDGFSRVQESDMLLHPDPNTFELLPWRGEDAPVARMFCDVSNLDGSPFEGDPRHVLRRNLDKARELGFSFYVGPDMEFFYFANDKKGKPAPIPLDSGGYFDLTTVDVATDLRRRTILALESIGIPVRYSHHEDSPSQHEIDLRYTDSLTMADNVMTFKLVVKEIALERACSLVHAQATGGRAGIGHAHPHLAVRGRRQRLSRPRRRGPPVQGGQGVRGRPAHPRPGDHRRHQPVGQLLQAAGRRLRGARLRRLGPEQPLGPGQDPGSKKGKGSSTRIQFRSPDPACNPYLAFAVILGAGLKRISEGYELTSELTANLYEMTAEERLAEGVDQLPGSLEEAIACMETSELLPDVLGEHVFEWFIRNKQVEWDAYRTQVTPFELDRYLPIL